MKTGLELVYGGYRALLRLMSRKE
nr:hypothetical protein [Bradyrhizobium sacchari]